MCTYIHVFSIFGYSLSVLNVEKAECKFTFKDDKSTDKVI